MTHGHCAPLSCNSRALAYLYFMVYSTLSESHSLSNPWRYLSCKKAYESSRLRFTQRTTKHRNSIRSKSIATQRLLHILCQCKTLGSFQYRSNPRDELRMAELPVKHASLICGSAWFCALVNFARGENQRGFSGRFLATSVPETIAGPVVVDAM